MSTDRDPFWNQYHRRRRRWDRWAAATGTLGLLLLAYATWSSGWAHLYRQRENEGVGFAAVFMEMLLASVLLGAASTLLSWPRPKPRTTHALDCVESEPAR